MSEPDDSERELLVIVHVIRLLPFWRDAEHDLTECGLRPSEHRSIGRDEFISRITEWGVQRTTMFTCVTCMNTFQRWGGDGMRAATWENDPVQAMAREIDKVRHHHRGRGKRERFEMELRAIIQLTAEHKAEFDAIIARLEWGLAARERERGGCDERP